MRNLFAINPIEKTIIASKTTLKKASIPNSPEYKNLMKLMKANPTFAVAEKEIKKPEGKQTYEGLTNAFIKQYISIKENATELEKQYATALELGKFPRARKWFLKTFQNFNMDEAKKEIDEAIHTKIIALAKERKETKDNNVVDMPAAANQ